MKINFLPKTLDKDSRARICLDVQSGEFSTDMHWHDCFEIIHIAKGRATVIFDGNAYELCSQDSFFIPPGRIHRCICDGEDSHRVVVGANNAFVLGGDTDEYERFIPRFSSDSEERLLFRASLYPEIAQAMSTLSSYDTEKLSARIFTESEIMRVFSLMYASWEKAGIVSERSNENPTVCEIEKYIRENFSSPLTAEGVARHLNVSYSYMAKLLSRCSKHSFTELLCIERVEQAKKMLISTEKSITDVGEECGFSDTSYFIAVFKRRTGVTPKLYRSKNA